MLLVLTAIVALGGGSRVPSPALLVVRPACILTMTGLLLAPGAWEWRPYRPLAWLLGAWALAITLQLVPLPPSLFLALPGHARFAEAAVVAGHAQSWRPISLAPDLTLNSLLSLLVPASVWVAFAGLGAGDRARTPWLVLGVAAVSVLFAVVQLAGGPDSPAYLYRSTSATLPVGLLANRNHQGTLMAIGLAGLVCWYVADAAWRRGGAATALAVLGGIAFALIGLLTGSRSGVLLMGTGIVLGFVSAGGIGRLGSLRRGWVAVAAAAVCILVLVATALMLGRAAAIDRLADTGTISDDLRFRAFPIMMRMVRDFAPWGTGFGGFDQVFRLYEPDAFLNLLYFNNAHDDWLEVLLTGGVPAVAVLIAALVWLVSRARMLWRVRQSREEAGDLLRARLGMVLVLLLAMASLSDYPLRTPLMALIGSIALCWVAAPYRSDALV